MSKTDYAAFDALLLDQIRHGKTRMAQLSEHKPLLDMAKPFCAPKPGSDPKPEWRIIDRRLQALRKAGRIRHDGKIWEVI